MEGEKRYLIVNGDDFGLALAVNLGIVRAHEEGILTSVSLMVRGAAAREAAAYAREHPELSVGLHVDLAEWTYRDWAWVPLYEVVPVDDEEVVRREVARQLDAFRDLMGKDPTHLDSHQHVHLDEPVRTVLVDLADDLNVPLRAVSPSIHYCGDFYGQTAEGLPYAEGISVSSLVRVVRSLPEGITELACHPGEGRDLAQLATSYRAERSAEVQALCDPGVREAISEAGIKLYSFANLTLH